MELCDYKLFVIVVLSVIDSSGQVAQNKCREKRGPYYINGKTTFLYLRNQFTLYMVEEVPFI